MKIEFYHVDAFELANYEPIWRELRHRGIDTHLVAPQDANNTAAQGWFDFERFKSYCDLRQIPFKTTADPTATLGITTQNADILRQYRYKVRLMYGPVIYPEAWALQAHAVQPFDAVLTHGNTYATQFQRWLRPKQLPIVGYARYDDFFAGLLQRDVIRARWGIQTKKPVLAFLPTWGENTGFDQFLPVLLQLKTQYEIILRPHHCTLRFEPERMARLNNSGCLILDNAFDLAEVYAAADVVLSDVRSGSLFEACLCDVPSVGMVIDPAELQGWLQQHGVGDMVSLCSHPEQLPAALELAMHSSEQASMRKRWVQEHVAYRQGDAAEQTALALIQLAEHAINRPATKLARAEITLSPVLHTNLEKN